MKKKLAILCYSNGTLEIYYEQIQSLFQDNLIIEKYCLENGPIQKEIVADLILLPSFDAFEKVRHLIKRVDKVLFADRTISKGGLDKMMDIEEGTEAFFLDESMEMSKQMVSTLYEIGVDHMNLTPICPTTEGNFKEKMIIVLGKSSNIPLNTTNILNIGNSLLDINTIIEIGVRLDYLHILNRQNIGKSYKEIATANYGLSRILGMTNMSEGQLDILLQVIDDGLIGIDAKGSIFLYNENAGEIVGYTREDVVHRDGILLFPQIPFKDVLENLRSVREILIKINGVDLIVSVDPIVHSERLYGAVAIIRRFSDAESQQHRLRAKVIGKGHKAKYNFEDIVGESENIRKTIEIAKRMARSNSSILITGESGTGKELFAQAIHNNSKRRNFQFVAINCGALPESLLESELFGYEEGAFTGARKGGKPGLFELAHNGTLFLDEIGEMPPSLQMRLLRVLQEREVMRLGGDSIINVDIRIIAATNKNLKEMMATGGFREDLYYRLNVLPLKIPPLRSRKKDIETLVDRFRAEFRGSFVLSPIAKDVLLSYNWKGNVRELKNYIEYLVSLEIKEVDVKDLPFEIFEEVEGNILLEEDAEAIVSSEERNIYNDLKEDAGKDLPKYTFILEELEKAFLSNKRLGRRSLLAIAKQKKMFLGEQEIRNMLLYLESKGMVEVYKGRGGTLITDRGKNILNYYAKSKGFNG